MTERISSKGIKSSIQGAQPSQAAPTMTSIPRSPSLLRDINSPPTEEPHPEPAILGREASMRGTFDWPVERVRVTDNYGLRPTRRTRAGNSTSLHQGVDFSGRDNTNSPEVRAVREGKVVFAGEMTGLKNVVIVKHEIQVNGGAPKTVYSLYGHLKGLQVNEGEPVPKGTHLGDIAPGTSGGISTGPHLHFSVIEKHGNRLMYVNPKKYLPPLGNEKELAEYKTAPFNFNLDGRGQASGKKMERGFTADRIEQGFKNIVRDLVIIGEAVFERVSGLIPGSTSSPEDTVVENRPKETGGAQSPNANKRAGSKQTTQAQDNTMAAASSPQGFAKTHHPSLALTYTTPNQPDPPTGEFVFEFRWERPQAAKPVKK